MAQHDAYLGPGLIGIPAVECHDRVRVPDGRSGEVIGFYRDAVEQLLVQFDTGGTGRYLPADLLLLPPGPESAAYSPLGNAIFSGATSGRPTSS